MSSASGYPIWTQSDEYTFIKGIGSYRQRRHGRPAPSRRVLLEGYIAGLELRTEWGELESAETMAFARNELRLLIEQEAKADGTDASQA